MCRTRTGTEKHTVNVTFSNYNPHQIEWNPIGSRSASSGSGRSSREQPPWWNNVFAHSSKMHGLKSNNRGRGTPNIGIQLGENLTYLE